jgi:hypothetical protein
LNYFSAFFLHLFVYFPLTTFSFFFLRLRSIDCLWFLYISLLFAISLPSIVDSVHIVSLFSPSVSTRFSLALFRSSATDLHFLLNSNPLKISPFFIPPIQIQTAGGGPSGPSGVGSSSSRSVDRSSRLCRSETAPTNAGHQQQQQQHHHIQHQGSEPTNRSSYYGVGGSGSGGGGPEMERSIYSERDRGYLSDMSSR